MIVQSNFILQVIRWVVTMSNFMPVNTQKESKNYSWLILLVLKLLMKQRMSHWTWCILMSAGEDILKKKLMKTLKNLCLTKSTSCKSCTIYQDVWEIVFWVTFHLGCTKIWKLKNYQKRRLKHGTCTTLRPSRDHLSQTIFSRSQWSLLDTWEILWWLKTDLEIQSVRFLSLMLLEIRVS